MPNSLTSLLADKKLMLVGCGKMGTALLQGWLDAGLSASQFIVQEPHADDNLKSLGVSLNPDMADAAAPDILVLAVKPQTIDTVLPPLAAHLSAQTTIISLMAGIPISALARLMGDAPSYVRTMPNTPASIGEGMTALYTGNDTDNARKAASEALLGAVGKTVWLNDEKQIDAVTAISGSGPAYVFYLAEALAAAAVNLGLSEEMAAQLAGQTIIGSAAMLKADDAEPQQLRINVTSPGGTTAAALDELMDANGLGELMRRATQAAANRAHELGQPKDD